MSRAANDGDLHQEMTGVQEKRSRRTLLSYFANGFVFSAWIPLTAWIQASAHTSSSGILQAVQQAHQTDPLLWLFDLIPFGFGALLAATKMKIRLVENALSNARYAIAEQDRLHKANQARLETRQRELDRLTDLHRASARRFEELFQGLPVACVTYDRDGVVYECNREFERLTGWNAPLVQLKPLGETIMRNVPEGIWRPMTNDVFAGTAVHDLELQNLTRKGKGQWHLCSSFPLRASDDQIVGAILTIIDITQRKEMEGQIEEQVQRLNETTAELQERGRELEQANVRLATLATIDSLTGVANRRLFRERLDLECEVAAETDSHLSLVLLDVDHFKSYNDSFGHQAGDEVLKSLADILKVSVRQGDLAARFGGEEFVILLPNTNARVALSIAERMRSQVEATEFPNRPVTASFGVATVDGKSVDVRALLEAADTAMYAAKKAGRNRVAHWDKLLCGQKNQAA